MNCGILIIGSLFWDDGTDGGRQHWRDNRLDVSRAVPVRVPIDYGRKSSSRSNTFTMVLRTDGPAGTGLLVPCRHEVLTIEDLVAEASALWKAEAPKAKTGALGSDWGSVGILFREGSADGSLAQSWQDHFRKAGRKSLSVVREDGSLDVPWPAREDGAAADFDLILATATLPEEIAPTPQAVANAMLGQTSGHENYFLNNVLHGIRTASDGEIFTVVERERPNWISADRYQDAVALLRQTTASLNPAEGQPSL